MIHANVQLTWSFSDLTEDDPASVSRQFHAEQFSATTFLRKGILKKGVNVNKFIKSKNKQGVNINNFIKSKLM